MADKVSKRTPFDAGALKRVIADINKHREAATEATGRVGKATKDACERHNYNTAALTLVSRLLKKEPAKQLEVLEAIVTYAHALGMFQNIDMFHDSVAAMQAILEEASKGNPASGPGVALVAGLAAATH